MKYQSIQCLFIFGLFFLAVSTRAQDIETSVFLMGNTGASQDLYAMGLVADEARKAQRPYLLLLGNSIPKKGFEDRKGKNILATMALQISGFEDRAILIPGEFEWSAYGRNGLSDLEKKIEEGSEAKFYPGNDNPIVMKELGEHAVLIVIDSQWYLEKWDERGYINGDSDVNSREQFFSEFGHLLKKAEGKIKLVALHHPIITHTRHGVLAETAGSSPKDFQSIHYRKLRSRLTTLAKQSEDVILLSGGDRNLQFLNEAGIVQIISGATNGKDRLKRNLGDSFGSDDSGYARLDILKDGSLVVHFYRIRDNRSVPLFSKTILTGSVHEPITQVRQQKGFPPVTKASIYAKEEVKKSKLYRAVWGGHYRNLYGREVAVPTVSLDTLQGGVVPLRSGGGQQTKSLRLRDHKGREFVMRALRKNTAKFIQANAFQDVYLGNALEGTYIDRTLRDFYTTANPYTPLAIGKLSEVVDVYHTDPLLYYMPKQALLGRFNADYGDELYLFEEHVGNSQVTLESFGSPKAILSTEEVLEEVVKNGKSVVDEPSYIRARLFDMLIGDWDRHEDQWRWALFENNDGTAFCKPIPRDRDQAFPKYDGILVSFLTRAIPGLRKMQSYGETLRSPKWLASSPYHLDVALINQSEWTDWEQQVNHIQSHLTDAEIDRAFQEIPLEVQGPIMEDIKKKLKGRRNRLIGIAKEYYDYLNRFEVLLGTEKDDDFGIVRNRDGKTTVRISRKDQELLHRTFSREETKEIWIYGLDGQDTFRVTGKGNRPIKIKILGGMENDTYDFVNRRKVKLYDYDSKPNTIVNKGSRKWLVDDYDVHHYDPKKVKHGQNQLLPILGYDPDDGLRVGAVDHYTYFGVATNPFTQRHSVSVSYYTATSGYDLSYTGEFAHIFHHWNLVVGSYFTSPNFSNNFFGFGNETTYDKDVVDLDFNRVRIRKSGIFMSLEYRGSNGGRFGIGPILEQFKVENTAGRFIASFPGQRTFFERQTYGGVQLDYHFGNKDNSAQPTRGLSMDLTLGYKANIGAGQPGNRFAYVSPRLAFDRKLIKNGTVVLATEMAAYLVTGENFEFYHAAQLGGDQGLRGFRNERFTGRQSFYQNTDLRVTLGTMRTSILPLQYGLSASYDFGRVWMKNDSSNHWHQSYGGSFWLGGLATFTTNLGYYASVDGGRAMLTFGFAF